VSHCTACGAVLAEDPAVTVCPHCGAAIGVPEVVLPPPTASPPLSPEAPAPWQPGASAPQGEAVRGQEPLGQGQQVVWGPPAAPLVCQRCGALTPAGSPTCRSCGAPLGMDATAYVTPGYQVPEPMGIGRAFDTVFKVYRRMFRPLVGTYALYAVPAGIASVALLACLWLAFPALMAQQSGANATLFPAGSTDPFAVFQVDSTAALGGVVLCSVVLLLVWLLSGWFTAACVVVGIQGLLGRSISTSEALAQARPFMWSVLGVLFLTGLATVVGACACVVGILWVWTAFFLATPALIVERLGCFQGIERSIRLAHADFWRLLGWIVVMHVLIGAFTLGPQLIGGIVLRALPPLTGQVISNTTSAIAEVLVAPILLVAQVVFYFDQRARIEGLDVVAAFRTLQQPH